MIIGLCASNFDLVHRFTQVAEKLVPFLLVLRRIMCSSAALGEVLYMLKG